ncbi:MAG: cobalt-zinc-cadmium efflux system outer membrane protein [Polyangiales bacterium]|jgi:cobalt-zinc-cadmium efflux system outer membrane protein
MMKRSVSNHPKAAKNSSILVITLSMFVVSPALAQERLQEADVVRIARERAPSVAVAEATERLAEARERTAGLMPNPTLGWERETIETSGQQQAQDMFRVNVPISIGGPRTQRSLQAVQSEWSRSMASVTRTNSVVEALHAYFDAALASQRVDVLAHALGNLEEAARIQTQREAAGVVSGYESTRLSIASELARSRHIEAVGTYESARARLAVLLGEQDVTVDPELRLSELGSEAALLAQTEERQALVHARQAEGLADEAERRSRFAWLPTLQLGGGLNRTNTGGLGYILGVQVSLPIFNRGQNLRAEALAQQSLQAAQSDALRRNMQAEVRSALTIYRTAREELTRFEAVTQDVLGTLLRAAQSGYREGERTILELLDAQRTQIEVNERRLALLWAAKHAETRLRAAVGDLR